MILSNDGLVAFHYRSYGTFFLHKNKLHKIRRGFTHYKYYRAHFYIQSDKNSFLKVVKVPKTKGITLDKFDKIIRCFQFGIGVG